MIETFFTTLKCFEYIIRVQTIVLSSRSEVSIVFRAIFRLSIIIKRSIIRNIVNIQNEFLFCDKRCEPSAETLCRM